MRYVKIKINYASLFFLVLSFSLSNQLFGQTLRPNIVLVIVDDQGRGQVGYNGHLNKDDQWKLYDLKNDPGETKDLSKELPERFEKMKSEAQAMIRSVTLTAVVQVLVRLSYNDPGEVLRQSPA